MELRLVKVLVPELSDAERDSILEGFEPASRWYETGGDGRVSLHLLLPAEQTEAAMDRVVRQFGTRPGFRIIVLPVEASMPRADTNRETEAGEPAEGSFRVSREELHASVSEGLNANPVYLALTLLSALVAAIGLIRDDLAVIIGAMVIAPLLQPNVALALATTLSDLDLGRRALVKGVIGVAAALALSVAFGLSVPFDPGVEAMRDRISVDMSHLVLALAAGAAGALSFSIGLSGAVIGVMVAVALMPPLVTTGIMLGAGLGREALGAGLLTLVNLICVNLAGVCTFLLQGVRPPGWREAQRARRTTVRALALWTLLLLLLVALVWLSNRQ